MDALSEAVISVRMIGAIFADAICSAPWGFAVPTMAEIAPILAPGAECVVGYHLVTEGKAAFGLEGTADIPVIADDTVIIPHGDPHTMINGTPPELIDSGAAFGRWMTGDVSPMRCDGGGEVTRFVCGYFGCDRHAARLFLAGLPSLIKISVRNCPAGQWLESSIRHLLGQAASGRPGCAALLSKMAEALFIEALRLYMEQLPPQASGWLAGTRDPVVGAVLALLHRQPCDPWTMAGHQMNTPWDPLHRAYFNGEAMWTYLTTPFLLQWTVCESRRPSRGGKAKRRGACCGPILLVRSRHIALFRILSSLKT